MTAKTKGVPEGCSVEAEKMGLCVLRWDRQCWVLTDSETGKIAGTYDPRERRLYPSDGLQLDWAEALRLVTAGRRRLSA